MCSFNILSFNNHFHSQGNSESDSLIHQSFIPSSFSKLQLKDLLGAPHSFLFCPKLQLLQSIQLFDSCPLLSASDHFLFMCYFNISQFLTISTAKTTLPISNLSPDHFYHVLFQHLVIFRCASIS